MDRKFFTLRLPFGRYVHYARGRKVGQSIRSFGDGLVHYDRRRRVKSKTVRTFVGEPNHYDTNGRCIGYSRKCNCFKSVHYNRRGQKVGYTYHILNLIFCHCVLERSELWACSPIRQKVAPNCADVSKICERKAA